MIHLLIFCSYPEDKQKSGLQVSVCMIALIFLEANYE